MREVEGAFYFQLRLCNLTWNAFFDFAAQFVS